MQSENKNLPVTRCLYVKKKPMQRNSAETKFHVQTEQRLIQRNLKIEPICPLHSPPKNELSF